MENEADNDERVDLSNTTTTMSSTESNEKSKVEENPTIDDDQEEENQCYICWEGPTESSEIRRDCGCNGSSGWVHTSCLIELAENRAQLSDPLLRPWSTCSQCLQPYKDPTKRILTKHLLGSAGRRKRLLKYFQSAGSTLLFTSLYFGAHSVVGCSVTFFGEYLALTWVERWEPAWEAASEKFQMIIYFVAACLIGMLLYEYRWQIWRASKQVATIWAALFVIGAPFVVEPHEVNMELCGVFGACIGFLSHQFYQNRGVIRHEFLELQRRGVLAALLQFAFMVFLFHLYGYIDEFVYSQFDKRVATGYMVRTLSTKQTLEELLEALRAVERQVEERVQLRQAFRDDYLYWTCCD